MKILSATEAIRQIQQRSYSKQLLDFLVRDYNLKPGQVIDITRGLYRGRDEAGQLAGREGEAGVSVRCQEVGRDGDQPRRLVTGHRVVEADQGGGASGLETGLDIVHDDQQSET